MIRLHASGSCDTANANLSDGLDKEGVCGKARPALFKEEDTKVGTPIYWRIRIFRQKEHCAAAGKGNTQRSVKGQPSKDR